MSAEIRSPCRPSCNASTSHDSPPFGTIGPWLRGLSEIETSRIRTALRELLASTPRGQIPRIDRCSLDQRIAAIDRALNRQLDALLHHPAIKQLEARWRGLAFVTERIAAGGSVRVEFLAASTQELAIDFEESPEFTQSGLYNLVYTRALATYGASPYGLLCGDFSSGPERHDLDLLRAIARVCAAAQVPFVGNASAGLLGVRDFAELAGLADVEASIAGAASRRWRALRADPNARYLGLCLPRFLLRAPIDVDRQPDSILRYREHIRDERDLLWGHASLAFTVRVAEAFHRYRWCVSILGSQLCEVIPADPPGLRSTCSVDLLVSRRLEGELTTSGLISMAYDRRLGGLTFHAAPSLASAPSETSCDELHTQLQYVFLSGRVAHYLRRIERDTLGAWDDPRQLEASLQAWLRRHVADLEDAHWETRSRRPFRRAKLQLERTPSGWIRVQLEIEPHFTHHGAPIVLTTNSRLDSAALQEHPHDANDPTPRP